MNDPSLAAGGVNRSLVDYTHWIYGLHALSVLIGLVTAGSVALRFTCSLPSLIAVVMNYARRGEARGTWLESHFRWQIRTFWFAWGWIILIFIVSMPLVLVLIGVLTDLAGMAIVGLWVIYRVGRGWLALRDGLPMPAPVVAS